MVKLRTAIQKNVEYQDDMGIDVDLLDIYFGRLLFIAVVGMILLLVVWYFWTRPIRTDAPHA